MTMVVLVLVVVAAAAVGRGDDHGDDGDFVLVRIKLLKWLSFILAGSINLWKEM